MRLQWSATSYTLRNNSQEESLHDPSRSSVAVPHEGGGNPFLRKHLQQATSLNDKRTRITPMSVTTQGDVDVVRADVAVSEIPRISPFPYRGPHAAPPRAQGATPPPGARACNQGVHVAFPHRLYPGKNGTASGPNGMKIKPSKGKASAFLASMRRVQPPNFMPFVSGPFFEGAAGRHGPAFNPNQERLSLWRVPAERGGSSGESSIPSLVPHNASNALFRPIMRACRRATRGATGH
jgi:hypothetical protein